LIYKEKTHEMPEVTYHTVAPAMEDEPSSPGLAAALCDAASDVDTPAWRWAARVGIALAFSLVVGALPVFVHREIRELTTLRAELQEVRGLNDKMYGRLEDSVARLRALKTPEGAARILREKGFLPPGARVYQLEIMDESAAGSPDRVGR